MGLKDKAKELGKKSVDLGKKAGKKTVELGKKGVDKTKDALRTKHCAECAHYTPVDDEKGECPVAGQRLATADVDTCPQRAFTPRENADE